MKIRSGFVSNSSSSSFIIAFSDKEEECLCCKRTNKFILQAIGKYITCLSEKSNKLYTMLDDESVEAHFQQKLKELDGSISFAEKRIKDLEELEKTPEAFDHYLKVKNELEVIRAKVSITQEAEMGKYISPADSISQRKADLQKHVKDYEKNRKELKDIIKKIKKAVKEGKVVYGFTIDNWATDAESALQKMIKDGIVETLWSEHT